MILAILSTVSSSSCCPLTQSVADVHSLHWHPRRSSLFSNYKIPSKSARTSSRRVTLFISSSLLLVSNILLLFSSVSISSLSCFSLLRVSVSFSSHVSLVCKMFHVLFILYSLFCYTSLCQTILQPFNTTHVDTLREANSSLLSLSQPTSEPVTSTFKPPVLVSTSTQSSSLSSPTTAIINASTETKEKSVTDLYPCFILTLIEENVKTINCSGTGLTTVPLPLPLDTESFIFSHNQLQDLHNQIHGDSLQHLVSLDLSFNSIRELGRGHLFLNFTHLKHLDLSGNHFKTLFAGVFRGMKRLETLIMREGQLKYIDEHAFAGLDNLRHLDLESNLIASVYLELFQSIVNLHVSEHLVSSFIQSVIAFRVYYTPFS